MQLKKIFIPLSVSIYGNKCVILTDHPSAERQAGVTQYLQTYPHLTNNNQFFQLPVRDLEQHYPDQADATYGNWRKTQAEIDAVNANGKKVLTGEKKKQLAKFVGNNITQAQFENDMQVCFNTLTRSWDFAFK